MPMIRVEGKCKACGKPLSLQVDQSYAELGDPYRLVQGAVCNRCGMTELRRRGIEDNIRRICLGINAAAPACQAGLKEQGRDVLVQLVEQYCQVAGRAFNATLPFDLVLVEDLLQSPGRYELVLQRIWKAAETLQPQKPLL